MKNNLLWLLTFLIGICWQNVSRAQCAGFSAAATTVSNYNGQAVSCFGAANGVANVVATGGTAPYSYLWSIGGQTGSMATGLPDGVYTVIATDAIGCTVTAAVTITQPTQIIVNNLTQVNVYCFGGANGFACVSATGGTGGYAFVWANGQTTSCASGLTAGNHMVTVTDINGCAAVGTTTITQPAMAIQASIGSQTNATCFNADGAACVLALGGTGLHSFLWSNGQTTSCASGLAAGSYTVTVMDANACTGVATTTITNTSASPISVSATTVSNYNGQAVTCFGAADGAAIAVATGGTAPYSYLWSIGGQTGSMVTGLSAGVYTVMATDAIGCTVTAAVTITQPTQIIVNNFNQSNVSCFGGADGAACPSVSGGIGAYTFAWANGQSTFCASGLMAGSYMVTVMDANGCIGVSTATITQPATAMQAVIGSQTNTTCLNANGTACAMAMGGVAPYMFLWSNGQMGSCVSGLWAGSYAVTVIDANNCEAVAATTITNTSVSSVSVNISSQVNLLCANTSSGSACAVATGGTAPYIFQWANGQTTSCASGLSAGNHTVTVIDGNGCAGVATITISQPATAMQVSIGSQTNATCLNANGSACAVVTGGVGIISYIWSNNGQATSCASGLSVGNHFVTATDANGCIDVATVAITNTSSISVGISSQVNVSCFGQANGSLCVSASGGVAPYNFIWSNGQTSSCATGLAAGSYTVTVTDVNNCPVVRNMTLTQPAQALQVAINQSCQLQNGSISATAVATGGTVFYNYLWNNGQTTGQVTGLLLGNVVTVSATDANGCQAQHTITVSNNITYTPQVVHNNCGINARLGRINLSVTAANPTFSWSNGQQTQNIFGLAAGVYTVTISAQGCQEIATFTVGGINIMPQITTIFCANAGTIQLNGNLPYQYLWSNGSTNSSLSSQNSQYYQVTITDPLSGCVIVQNYYLGNYCHSVIEGRVNYVDANGNCTGATPYNIGTVWLRELHSNNVYMTTINQGFYRFYVNQSDSFEVFIDTTRSAVQMICPTPTRQAIHVPLGQTVTVPSFYVDVNGNDLQVLPFSGGFSPGFTRSMCFIVQNDGEAINSPFVVLQYPPTIQFVNTTTPHQHDAANHQITLTLPSMPHNQAYFICLNFFTPIGTPLGTMLPFGATIYPLAGDLTPSNNTRQNIFTVVGSYDPNDKQVQPFHTNNEFLGGVIFPEEDTLHYTIRFQNTGTAPAEFVIIRDTLDAHLLPETIHNIETSHNANVRLAGRELVFEMDNIMLPDSATDLEGSQGFVKFSINRDNTLPLGTNIANTAAIYFDYNLPVITNTTNSVVDILSALERMPTTQHQWKVMPNPFDENLTIQYTLHQSSATQIYLVNALGQTVQMLPQQAVQTAGEYQTQISTQALPSGIYWIVLETAQGKLAQKIVKQGSR